MAESNQIDSGNLSNTGNNTGQIVNVGGKGNKVTVKQQKTPEEPLSTGVNTVNNLLIDVSRFFFEKLGKKYYSSFFVLSGISGISAILGFIYNSVIQTGWPLIISILVLLFSIAMIQTPSKSTCRSCKQPFSMYEVDRKLVNKKKVGNEMVYNYKVFQECNKCGFKRDYTAVEKEDID